MSNTKDIAKIFKDFEKTASQFVEDEYRVDFRQNLVAAIGLIKPYIGYIDYFIELTVCGKQKYDALAKEIEDHQRDAVFAGLSYPNRFYKKATDEQRHIMRKANLQLFYFGLLTHFSSTSHDDRSQFIGNKVQADNFAATIMTDFQIQSLTADKQVESFTATISDIPRALFDSYYTQTIEPVIAANFKPGRLQRSKNSSYFYNMYCAGYLLGISHDMACEAQEA